MPDGHPPKHPKISNQGSMNKFIAKKSPRNLELKKNINVGKPCLTERLSQDKRKISSLRMPSQSNDK